MDFKNKDTYFADLLAERGRPLVIAGPCSAESEQQVMQTAEALKKLNVHLFRAGIWKPRSRPNTFEGVGLQGLTWLARVKQELGMRVTTEVATGRHVEEALKQGIDVLWIGARTTVNPFAVQEIADALSGVQIPVMVKNPVNPDLALWIGAIERIYQAGITDLAAIHRGFSSYQPSKYRNAPVWQIPIELKARFQNLPVIVDPSHIGGTRDLIYPLSQRALDMGCDGVMIETHPNPAEALSDAEQQVTPAALADILSKLQVRKTNYDDAELVNRAEELRLKIDAADHDLIGALAQRMALVEQIGEYKKQNNVQVLQLERWKEIFRTRADWAAEAGISPAFVEELYKLIHVESIRKQTSIMQAGNPEAKPNTEPEQAS
ncbi:bifunctional 3-deoxy-7-phosphoheptulonate synthase/chorismate mutase type II [Pontibacter sp. BT731]|uniref:bifunctional 3-deoxy-7-phosphoheptulonate synthase/chorismate mutase type II n=1 Tax=Pontibacter coccineus TaxID=3063328 RepID=UPI0026E4779E|nr:bifunctional 3-deoxy-7-phosphoheptulonate synthase/chorismate mutase type II [Pontibacter sp. BT731]MDO6390043.1 bifunctional 3-deoxy-7-phosphoheptulonate synthase/chorismate mutase type II [Pontibacter sp. BT731]